MALSSVSVPPGSRLGPYEVLGMLGSGGMGEVYRARDPRLGREVAIKVIPEAFARDPERLARFEREARLLAALSHPHIATVYGFEEDGERKFLAMELVRGEGLDERMAGEPLSVPEAVSIARQIAGALEAAHDSGIVHRDLKPSNVKLTPEGSVKVLDFGLAKAVEGEHSSSPDLSRSPTATAHTQAGVILGTAAYMSPEQARGKAVDKRSDIWSFGCVFYEMLSGRKAFSGETGTDVFAAILRSDPDLGLLPSSVPLKVREILSRCLQKDSARRPRDARDIRLVLEEAVSEPAREFAATAEPAPPRRARGSLIGLAGLLAGALVSGLSVWGLARSRPAEPRAPVRFTLVPSGHDVLIGAGLALVLSPDGRSLVYAGTAEGIDRLFARPLGELEAKPISGTDHARSPFFSPDGKWVGFFAGGKLKKAPLAGGEAATLCDAANRGASWGPDGRIAFLREWGSESLSLVSASGGEPEEVPAPEAARALGPADYKVIWPHVLPLGQAALYTAWRGSVETADVFAQSFRTGERRILIKGATNPRYLPTGHLLFARLQGRSGSLWAAPFDPERLELTGPAAPVLENLRVNQGGAAQFSVSDDGTLAYIPAPRLDERALLRVDENGNARPISNARRDYRMPRFSPDGKRLVFEVRQETGSDIWIHDIERDTTTRLTSDDTADAYPIWTPDGQWVAFGSARGGAFNLYRRRTDGSGREERLTTSESDHFPQSFSSDGKLLAFTDRSSAGQLDLWVLPMEGERGPRPLLATPFAERGGAFSPDGRFIAYVSNESGQNEVSVKPVPDTGEKWQISSAGGTGAVWSPDGREIYYRAGDDLMAVPVALSPSFRPGRPRPFFKAPYDEARAGTQAHASYDVSPDGTYFVFLERTPLQTAPEVVHVVVNWLEELKRKVPPRR